MSVAPRWKPAFIVQWFSIPEDSLYLSMYGDSQPKSFWAWGLETGSWYAPLVLTPMLWMLWHLGQLLYLLCHKASMPIRKPVPSLKAGIPSVQVWRKPLSPTKSKMYNCGNFLQCKNHQQVPFLLSLSCTSLNLADSLTWWIQFQFSVISSKFLP